MEQLLEREKAKVEKDFYKIGGGISMIYLAIILLIYPLYIHDGYYDILQVKFKFFWVLTLAYTVIMLAFLLLHALTLKNGMRKPLYFSLFIREEEGKKKPFLATDIPFFFLILIFLISMIHSGYIYETWWGSTGRYMGSFTWLLLFFAYFFVSRFYRFKKIHLLFLSISIALQAAWGISDFFWMNLFHFFDLVEDKILWSTFAGGIGNINGYTSLMISYTGLFVGLYLGEKKWKWSLLFLLMYAYTLLAAFYGMSDNAVFALFVLFLVLPFFCFGKKERLLNCLDLYLAFFLMMKFATFFIPETGSSYNEGAEAFFLQLGFTTIPFLAIAVLGILRLVITKLKEESIGKVLRPIYILVLISILLAVVFIFYDANVSHHLSFLESYSNYFRFDDNWGSGRGFIWKMGLDYFSHKMPFNQVLLGYGPDGYYMLTNDHYKVAISQSYYPAIDNIHNEYLNLLLTIGILGLIAYICVIIFFLKTLFTKKEWDGEQSFTQTAFPFATGLCLLCYLGQAIVNIAVPMVLPVIFILAFLGLGSKAGGKEA